MRGKKQKTDEPVGNALIRAFQKYGYEGASLSSLSEETGLIKASLYHRFPGGKQQMASVALEKAKDYLRTEMLAPLESDLPLEERLHGVIQHLRDFYRNGRKSCLLNTLSLDGTPESVTQKSGETAQLWASAFAKFARVGGMPAAAAKLAAEDALIQIEGALVLCRVLGTTAPFERALARLPDILIR